MTQVIAAIVLSMLFSVPAFAGPRTGNGGDGYRAGDGKIHLLDLVESGNEDAPY